MHSLKSSFKSKSIYALNYDKKNTADYIKNINCA